MGFLPSDLDLYFIHGLTLIHIEENFMKKLNGIKLKHRKNTENSSTVVFPVPGKRDTCRRSVSRSRCRL